MEFCDNVDKIRLIFVARCYVLGAGSQQCPDCTTLHGNNRHQHASHEIISNAFVRGGTVFTSSSVTVEIARVDSCYADQGHLRSRSVILVPIESPYATSFLLVINTNLQPISHRCHYCFWQGVPLCNEFVLTKLRQDRVYFAARWHFGDVLQSNIIFCDICCFRSASLQMPS